MKNRNLAADRTDFTDMERVYYGNACVFIRAISAIRG